MRGLPAQESSGKDWDILGAKLPGARIYENAVVLEPQGLKQELQTVGPRTQV